MAGAARSIGECCCIFHGAAAPKRRSSGLYSVAKFLSPSAITDRKLTRVYVSRPPTNPLLPPEEDNGNNQKNTNIFSLPQEDLNYLLKLAGGSIGGAAGIKYGSALFPEITKPYLLQALLMISIPVLVSVLLLFWLSGIKTQDQDSF